MELLHSQKWRHCTSASDRLTAAKGYISAEELLGIPELSINPLAQRLVRLFESVNFMEFARMLAAFSSRASTDEKLNFMFTVYDVDGDGIVSRDDMDVMLRQLGGTTLSDDDIKELIGAGFAEAGTNDGLTPAAFKAALKEQDLKGMMVHVPIEL